MPASRSARRSRTAWRRTSTTSRDVRFRLKQCDNLAAEREQRRALELDPGVRCRAHGTRPSRAPERRLRGGIDRELPGGSEAHCRPSREGAAHRGVDELVTPTVPVPGDEQFQKARVMKGIDELEARYPQDEYVLYWGGWPTTSSGSGTGPRVLQAVPRDRSWAVLRGGLRSHLLARLGRDDEQLPMLLRAVEARPNAANRASLAMGLAHRQPEEASRQARRRSGWPRPGNWASSRTRGAPSPFPATRRRR